jgi:predicted AAA+ superfamily ATPase
LGRGLIEIITGPRRAGKSVFAHLLLRDRAAATAMKSAADHGTA